MPREFSDAKTLRIVSQLASTVRAGLSVSRTVKHLEQGQASGQFRRLWQQVGRDVEQGKTFAEALRRQSPPLPRLAADLIAAGEQSGHLDEVLARLRTYYDFRASLKRRALGASAYPAFLTLFALSIWTLLRVITADDKMAAFWDQMLAYGAVLGLIVVVVFFFRSTAVGRRIWGGFVLYVPVVGGAVRRLALARFGRTLAMMYSSGMPMARSLDRACDAAGNVFVSESLRRASQQVASGATLSEALGASRFMSPLMRESIQTGEMTGTLDEALHNMADIYEDEARVVLQNLPMLIAPIMVILIGALVVYLYYTYYIKPYIIDPVNQLM